MLKGRIDMINNKQLVKTGLRIAVIGSGFCGLSAVTNLIKDLGKSGKQASITIFEKDEITKGSMFDTKLSDLFRLNHEANFMGTINFMDFNASYDDFYEWVQKNEDVFLQEENKTLAQN